LQGKTRYAKHCNEHQLNYYLLTYILYFFDSRYMALKAITNSLFLQERLSSRKRLLQFALTAHARALVPSRR
jgi:hypothetical protein